MPQQHYSTGEDMTKSKRLALNRNIVLMHTQALVTKIEKSIRLISQRRTDSIRVCLANLK